MATELPEYERPPVVEVVASVQFVPVPQFGMREAVSVSRAFDGWEVIDVPPALEPIVEAPSGHLVAPTLRFGLGNPPVRLLLGTEDGRWIAQIQQDRVAAHERKLTKRPSFANAAPQLRKVSARAAKALDRTLLEGEHRAEIVEVVYENQIPAGEGWTSFSQLNRVLRVVARTAGDPPYRTFEQAQVAFAYELVEDGEFLGRLRVIANPQVEPDGARSIHLRLIGRRVVGDRELDSVLAQCHADVVQGFTAVTTERMHKIWGRFR